MTQIYNESICILWANIIINNDSVNTNNTLRNNAKDQNLREYYNSRETEKE